MPVWFSKIHKNPTKPKFIITVLTCLVKPFSKTITTSLNLLYNQFKHYNFKTQSYFSVITILVSILFWYQNILASSEQ